MKHGTPWIRFGIQPGQEPPREVKMRGRIPLGIAFGDIGLDARDFPKIAEAVSSLNRAFAADFPETEFVEAE
jgi:hypothetical protein